MSRAWEKNEPFQCRVCACCRTGIDEEFAIFFEGIELVSVTGDEDIDFEFPLNQSQTFIIAPRDNLVAMTQANVKLANCDNFLVWIIAL